jgi:hypothetical protein
VRPQGLALNQAIMEFSAEGRLAIETAKEPAGRFRSATFWDQNL